MAAIRVNSALLCVNCDTIFEFSEGVCNEVCPICSSNSYIRLSAILNRTEEENK